MSTDFLEEKYSHLKLLLRDENGALYLDTTSNQFMDGAVLHLEIYNWSHNIYKKLRRKLELVSEALRNKGYKEIFATPSDSKAEKLLTMFGLEYTGITIGGFKLMRKSLWQ